ncbi:MAG: HAMP domain-containing histidine kinase [Halieaceae bacterium]|jgi:signal transduction histidine kinase|nr:HAMP domain-containing histidine kinase [Halieaceae bacterium]
MQVRKVLTSLTFRYIARYLTVLCATVFILLACLYAYFSYTYFDELSESIVEEVETIQIIYRGQSLKGVNQYIEDQLSTPATSRYYYLVTDSQGRKVAGDLSASPSYIEFSEGWVGFSAALLQLGKPVEVDFLARPATLDDGNQIIVARYYADAFEKANLVFSSLSRAMVATLLLGVIGGFFSASATLNRVEHLNMELSRIIRGNPGQRLNMEQEKGYVRELAVIMNDMLDQMESLMQGVRRVSDNIAHDLRTPLTRIRNNLSQLRADSLAESSSRNVEQIIAECDDLLETFNALLRISALEAGSRISGNNEVDIGAVLHDVVELYEPLAQQKGIVIGIDAPAQHNCRGDADLIFQMFANLIDNAVKYSAENGIIEVRMRTLPDQVHSIIIADSGPGIPAADRKNVFRRFFRIQSSRSETPGHGLGLSLVRAIAQYHQGSVELGSNNPGLQVRVKLPGTTLSHSVTS